MQCELMRMVENYRKENILEHIDKNPGEYIREISEELGINRKTLWDVLSKMEEEGEITAVSDGDIKRYYPDDIETEDIPIPLTAVQKEIVRIIVRDMDSAYDDVADELGKNTNTIYYHVQDLVERDVIGRTKVRGKTRLFLTTDNVPVDVPPISVTPKQRVVVDIIKTVGQISKRELAKVLNVAYSNAHRYIKRLQEFGVLRSEKRGLTRYYSLKEGVMDRFETRDTTEKVRRYIAEHPGEHFRSILRALGLSKGSLAHHLQKLTDEKEITCRQVRPFKYYYPADWEGPPPSLSPKQKEIAELISRCPGLDARSIAKVRGSTLQAADYHLKKILKKGIVRRETEEGIYCYYMAE